MTKTRCKCGSTDTTIFNGSPSTDEGSRLCLTCGRVNRGGGWRTEKEDEAHYQQDLAYSVALANGWR